MRIHPEELIPKNSSTQKRKISFFEKSKSIWGYMMKIKNVENDVLKVLTYVRTHSEELLVTKNMITLSFFRTMSFSG